MPHDHASRPACGRLPPIAPAWRDVALKYRDDPIAHERLKRTVLSGSDGTRGTRPGRRSLGIPPNAEDVSEADAHRLVNWILVLVP